MAVIDSIPELAYNEAGLIPCIVQDAKTREVLMMAWMNEESVRLTLEERTTWFFSRSRQELWHKGGTSGNTQALIELRYDCDADCAPITNEVDWRMSAKWLDVLSRSGTPLFVSVDPKKTGPEQKQALREAFSRAAVNTEPAEPLDWQETTAPRIWKSVYGVAEYDFDAFYGYDAGDVWWR